MSSPEQAPDLECVVVGAWKAHRASGELVSDAQTQLLEPKVMELLFVLAERRGEVVPREEIVARLWPRVVVTDDSLARCVFKLRKALGDDTRPPRLVETLPKRGYRLAVEPSTVCANTPNRKRRWSLLAAAVFVVACSLPFLIRPSPPESSQLLTRADDFYHQITLPQNEAAIELYERLIARNEQLVGAYSGLANALAQRAIRWPDGAQTKVPYSKLSDALRGGQMRTGYPAEQLASAHRFAQKAIEIDPGDARGHKAMGLVLSAQEDFAGALNSLERAIALNRDGWDALIDAGDVLEISGRPLEALPYFERAYEVMTRQREKFTTRIMPWYAPTAVLIGDRYEKMGNVVVAMQWYRRAVDYAPLDVDATRRLAHLLRQSGNGLAAEQLCDQLQQRLGRGSACAVTAQR